MKSSFIKFNLALCTIYDKITPHLVKFLSITPLTSTDHDEWVLCSMSDPNVSLLQVLLS